MKARDGPVDAPEIVELRENGRSSDSAFFYKFEPPKKAPVSRLISTPKRATGTGSKRTRKPRDSKTKKPPKTDGYLWRKDGAGWELRKTVYVDDGTGSKVRKRPYVARMAKATFDEMKKRHKGSALDRAIAEWIAEHDR